VEQVHSLRFYTPPSAGPISHGKEDKENYDASDDKECDDKEDSHQEQDDAILKSDDKMEA
jgi:hypothetical protein